MIAVIDCDLLGNYDLLADLKIIVNHSNHTNLPVRRCGFKMNTWREVMQRRKQVK